MDWTKRARGLIAGVMVGLVVAGCHTPGWHIEDAPGEEWHVDGPVLGAGADYEAEFHAITPGLVARLIAQPKTAAPGGRVETRPPTADRPVMEYRIGAGDLLSVIVFGHPDLTNPAGTTESVEASGRLVDANGEIFMPFIGEIAVAGQTVDQVRREIASGLAPFINNPQVDVRVIQFRSQSVVVIGDLPRPCRVALRDVPMTVVEVLDECQSLGLPGGGGGQALRDANAVQLLRGREAYTLVLSDLYRTGLGPVHVQDGDRIVLDNRINRVFLVGEFTEQSAVALPAGGLSLADAIAAAGGVNLGTASTSELFVIRGFVDASRDATGDVVTLPRPHVYRLDAASVDSLLLADQFPLQPRDVVFAAPADLVNFNRALNQLTPSLDILLRSAILFTR